MAACRNIAVGLVAGHPYKARSHNRASPVRSHSDQASKGPLEIQGHKGDGSLAVAMGWDVLNRLVIRDSAEVALLTKSIKLSSM